MRLRALFYFLHTIRHTNKFGIKRHRLVLMLVLNFAYS